MWARTLRAVYKYCHDHYRDEEGVSLLPETPTLVLSSKRLWNNVPARNSRVRSNDLGRWLDAIEIIRSKALTTRTDTTVAAYDALNFVLFTGLPRSEVLGLEWDRVDLGARYFWIDKTKNGEPLELPITDTLLSVLRRRWDMCGEVSPYVFPGPSPNKSFHDPKKTIANIELATVPVPNPDGLKPIKFRTHDIRRTFASVAALLNINVYTLKRLMNHKSSRGDVTQNYLSFNADELRKPAELIEHALLEHAGLVSASNTAVDNQLMALISAMDESTKMRFLADIITKVNVSNSDT